MTHKLLILLLFLNPLVIRQAAADNGDRFIPTEMEMADLIAFLLAPQ